MMQSMPVRSGDDFHEFDHDCIQIATENDEIVKMGNNKMTVTEAWNDIMGDDQSSMQRSQDQ